MAGYRTEDDPASEARSAGYLWVCSGVVSASIAVDRIFFHPAMGMRWLSAANAILFLGIGAWLVIKRRPPLIPIDEWIAERWGSRVKWLVRMIYFTAVALLIWLLSRLN